MTGKAKNRLLAGAFILSLFVAYKLALSKTIRIRQRLIREKKESVMNRDISTTLFRLKRQKRYNDSILKTYKSYTHNSFQNNLLQGITRFTGNNSIEVLRFAEPHEYSKDGANYTDYQIRLSGTYENILKLFYQLEEEYKYGKLLSVDFEKKKDYKTGKQYLVVDFILQRME